MRQQAVDSRRAAQVSLHAQLYSGSRQQAAAQQNQQQQRSTAAAARSPLTVMTTLSTRPSLTASCTRWMISSCGQGKGGHTSKVEGVRSKARAEHCCTCCSKGCWQTAAAARLGSSTLYLGPANNPSTNPSSHHAARVLPHRLLHVALQRLDVAKQRLRLPLRQRGRLERDQPARQVGGGRGAMNASAEKL